MKTMEEILLVVAECSNSLQGTLHCDDTSRVCDDPNSENKVYNCNQGVGTSYNEGVETRNHFTIPENSTFLSNQFNVSTCFFIHFNVSKIIILG